jgi:hypothetical protein
VSSFHLRRLATVATAASLALMLLGTSVAQASPPPAEWGSTSPTTLTSSASPALAVAGGTVWFQTSYQNTSSSTLASLLLKVTADGAVATFGTPSKYAIFVSGDRSTGCANATPVSCTFKNVKPLQTVKVAFVLSVPASFVGHTCDFGRSQGFGVLPPATDQVTAAFCSKSEWSSVGAPGSDPGASHGDTWNWFDAVKLSTDTNYSGSFALDITSVSNDQTLVALKNPQATTAFLRGASQIPVTVLDGETVDPGCNSVLIDCSTDLWGEWSVVSVNNGDPVTGLTLYEFQIKFDSSEIPNGVNQNNIQIYHAWTSPPAGEELISATCTLSAGVATNAPCLTVKKLAGGDLQVTIWSNHNGSLKGAV